MDLEPECLFKLIVGVSWVLYLWESYLDYRQYRVHNETLERPEYIKEIISEDEFKKARWYKLDKERFSFLTNFFSQAQTTMILCYGVLPWLWTWSQNYPFSSFVFVTVCSLAETVISLPFNLYDTFVIEETHGFNKQSIGFFFVDKLKKIIVSLVITAPILYIIEWIVDHGGEYFFVYVWAFLSVVVLLLMTVYPEFIAPLFDKYIPLPDGELKAAIEALAASVDYPLTKLYVVHGSKRSAHSNAYMYGFWKNKRIVLYDTLLSGEEKEKVLKECGSTEEDEKDKARGMSNEEVVAVLGHELGHWALSHTLVNLIITELNLLMMLTVFAYFYKWQLLYTAFGFESSSTIIGLILVFQYVMAPYNQIISTVMNMYTRRLEFQADAYAVEHGHGKQMIGALTKLGRDNLSLPIDDHLYSMCNHSHPPIPERISTINELMKKGK